MFDYLQIAYRPDLELLVRWMRQPSEQEMREGYEAVLTAAQHHQCFYWLVDVRRRDHSNKEATGWMMTSFLPRLHPLLGAKTYLAYLFAPAHLADIESDPSVPPLTYFDGRPYQIERFVVEDQAVSWLKQGHAHGQSTRRAQYK